MNARFEFRAGLWPTLATAAGVVLTVSLGFWQLGRGQDKAALGTRLEQLAREPAILVSERELAARDVELRRVEARGTYAPELMVLIDNRLRQGIAGYHVVMPLRLGGDRHVLVNRGWIAAGPNRSQLPRIVTPEGTVTVTGLAVVPSPRFLELSGRVMQGRVWQNLTIERYREAVPIAIQPFLIQQAPDGAPEDGLVREWQPPDLGADKHYGYAFQWFGLAAALLIFYLIAHVRRRREA